MKLVHSMVLCVILGLIASCSGSSGGPGPIDGIYENVTLTCDGTPKSLGGTATLTITNTTGVFKLVNGGCTYTQG